MKTKGPHTHAEATITCTQQAAKAATDEQNLERDNSTSFIQYVLILLSNLLQLLTEKDKSIAEKDKTIAELESKVKTLTEENAKLTEKVNEPVKTSENSSIPPSKNRYPKKKPPKLDENGNPIKGTPGAKKGHKAHPRKKIIIKDSTTDPEILDKDANTVPIKEETIEPESTECSKCGTQMRRCPSKDKIDGQFEFIPNPIQFKKYHSNAYRCPNCKNTHFGPKPEILGSGKFGPMLISVLIYLRSVSAMSITNIMKFLEAFGVKACRGFISETITNSAKAFDKSYDELKDALPNQKVVNADETSHKENGKKIWTWVFRTFGFAFFHIDVDRAVGVIEDHVTKEFKGTMGSDYLGSYRKFAKECKVKFQFCLAHLKRDIQLLIDHISIPELSNYGTKLMTILDNLFKTYRLFCRLAKPRDPNDPDDLDLEGEAREAKKQEVLEEARRLAEQLRQTALDPPNHKKAKNIAKRFKDWPDNYYATFLSDEGIEAGVEPTNNVSERSIRFVVIARHLTQGTRSKEGRHCWERLWTVVGTCTIQGRSIFKFIKNSIVAKFCSKDQAPPSLLRKSDDE
ncbi:MAG: IS66 family transposase [Deltaproteobacteria bacterium]|jgi:transposase|nr:IS66 family transposase [Deltaproteobacteria bacterium]